MFTTPVHPWHWQGQSYPAKLALHENKQADKGHFIADGAVYTPWPCKGWNWHSRCGRKGLCLLLRCLLFIVWLYQDSRATLSKRKITRTIFSHEHQWRISWPGRPRASVWIIWRAIGVVSNVNGEKSYLAPAQLVWQSDAPTMHPCLRIHLTWQSKNSCFCIPQHAYLSRVCCVKWLYFLRRRCLLVPLSPTFRHKIKHLLRVREPRPEGNKIFMQNFVLKSEGTKLCRQRLKGYRKAGLLWTIFEVFALLLI